MGTVDELVDELQSHAGGRQVAIELPGGRYMSAAVDEVEAPDGTRLVVVAPVDTLTFDDPDDADEDDAP